MNLLFISPYLPHPQCGHGAGVFIYELLIRLAKNHKITLVSFCDKREAELARDYGTLPVTLYTLSRSKGTDEGSNGKMKLAIIRAFQLLGSILRWEPYYVSKYRSKELSSLIRELTTKNKYDVVQVEFTQLARYLHDIHQGKIMLHELDVSYRPAYRRYKNASNLFKKFITFIELCRWAKYELSYSKKYDRVLTVTDKDRLLLKWLTKKDNVRYFPHAYEVASQIPEYNTRKPHTLVFVGTYSHQPNVDAAEWLCKEIFPAIQLTYSDAVLYLIGPNPSAEMKRAGESNPNIHVTGFVEDVNIYLKECSVFISPLRFGGGVKNKVLAAMAQGIPVVSTSVGAEGIDGADSSNILVGDCVEKLTECVSRLFEDRKLAAEYGHRGWENVKKWYSWESIVKKLENIFKEVA